AASKTEEKAPVSTCWRILNAVRRAGEIFDLTKAIANFRMHPVDEVARRDSFARFRLDLDHAQGSLIATAQDQFVSLRNNDLAGSGVRVRCFRRPCAPDSHAF